MNEAPLGGVVHDVSGFIHLDHESGLPARQIVVFAETAEDAINQADAALAVGTKLLSAPSRR